MTERRTHGSRTVEPVPGSDRGLGRSGARAPGPPVPRHARRDQRAPPASVRDVERPDPSAQRQPDRPAWRRRSSTSCERAIRSSSESTASSASGCARWPGVSEPRWFGSTRPGAKPSIPICSCAAHPSPSIIAVVHAETSTGVRNDIEPLGRGKGDALLLVDMVTSLGGIEVEVDDWSVDIAYSGTQKCLGVPPGLSPLTVSPRALERLLERPSSWYLDLNLLSQYVQDGSGGGRVYHHTAPVSMVAALHAGLGVLLDEGMPRCSNATPTAGRSCRTGLEALGLELLVEPGSPAAPADHRQGARGRRRRRVPAPAARPSTGSRSEPEPGSWPDRSGGSAAWATRRAGAMSSRCSAR